MVVVGAKVVEVHDPTMGVVGRIKRRCGRVVDICVAPEAPCRSTAEGLEDDRNGRWQDLAVRDVRGPDVRQGTQPYPGVSVAVADGHAVSRSKVDPAEPDPHPEGVDVARHNGRDAPDPRRIGVGRLDLLVKGRQGRIVERVEAIPRLEDVRDV